MLEFLTVFFLDAEAKILNIEMNTYDLFAFELSLQIRRFFNAPFFPDVLTKCF